VSKRVNVNGDVTYNNLVASPNTKDVLMSAESLRELFTEELRDIYDAEKQLTKALPKMAKAASSEELRAAFEEHLEATEGQVERVEGVFALLQIPARGKKCEGMEGLIKEGREAMEEMEGSVLDAALIASAQKIEHYEIASYGTLATFANVLGLGEAKNLLGETLTEEKQADELLTRIASQINPEAETEGDGSEDAEEDTPRNRSQAGRKAPSAAGQARRR
jgi:ferritin-like metal-binding protein YciE